MDKMNCTMHGGCPCENHSLLTELQELDFAIVEVTLYLDVYPDCCEAKEYLETMRAKRAKVAAEYESKHGMLTMYGVCGESSDKCAHWPWHYEAN
jgi:spore coat protein JB